jgi:hypothetical protein
LIFAYGSFAVGACYRTPPRRQACPRAVGIHAPASFPGLVGPRVEKPPASIRQYFLDWLDRDGYPFWPFWPHVASWWAIRDLPNLMLVHFEELRRDLPGQMGVTCRFVQNRTLTSLSD